MNARELEFFCARRGVREAAELIMVVVSVGRRVQRPSQH